jgi:hypothetical protein
VTTGRREIHEGGVRLAERYRIECSVGGPLFETLQVDVTVTAPAQWEVEPAQRPGLLADVGLGPIEILLVPLERQLAEKLHAYTRPYDGGSTRVKDLVDFVVIRLFERVDAQRLADAIAQTFASRSTHQVPPHLPPSPVDWERAYREEAEAVGITPVLQEADDLAASWLGPILEGNARGHWDPERSAWVDETSSN